MHSTFALKILVTAYADNCSDYVHKAENQNRYRILLGKKPESRDSLNKHTSTTDINYD